MKFIRYFLVLLILIAVASPALAGGLWDLAKNSDLPIRETKAFQLEVKGVNTRVYVFNNPEMKSYCTIIYGDETATTLQCKTYKEMGIPLNGKIE